MKIQLDLSSPKPFSKHFLFGIGSGHAPLLLRKDAVEQLKFIHDTLGIQQVRFHGIFNDDMNVVRSLQDVLPLPGAERFVDISFERIGEVYDHVLEAGMKPFVELGFMPSHFAAHKEQRTLFYYGYPGSASMPKEEAKWQDFIRSFVYFLFDRYGEEEVLTWNFEVWNEPNLIVFFGGSQADYFRLYEMTARAVKSVHPKLKIGGPATAASEWIPEFLRFVKGHNVPCDFISTHQYAGDPIGQIAGGDSTHKEGSSPFSNPTILSSVPNGSILSGLRHVFIDKSERDEMRNDTIILNAKSAKQLVGDLPLYYTEWNENATFSAVSNDTRKVAAFLVMTALKTEGSIDGSSVWCFSDIFEEMHMFHEEFHGGFGLLSHHGIPKPSYYALKFLSQVGEERFATPDQMGDITVAAFQSEQGDIQILLTRQKMKNLDLGKEEVEVVLPKNGFSSAFLSAISEDSGNPYKEYKKMGKAELSKVEIAAIKEKSQVKKLSLPFQEKGLETTFRVELGVNDVLLVEFRKAKGVNR